MQSVSAARFFATLGGWELALLLLAFLACFTNGLVYPSIGLVLGEVAAAYDPAHGDRVEAIMLDLLKKICLAAGFLWVTGYIYYSLFQQLAETVSARLRGRYFRALLK